MESALIFQPLKKFYRTAIIFIKKTPVLTFQASAECQASSDTLTNVIRLIYNDLDNEKWTGQTIYYHWVDEQTDSVLDMDYLNKVTTANNIYGSFVLPLPADTAAIPQTDFYTWTETFLEATPDSVHFGYVYETVSGKTLLRYYLKHQAIMKSGRKYTAHIALNVEDLTDSICGMFNTLEIHSAAQLALNGEVQSSSTPSGLCGDLIYDATLRVFEKDTKQDNQIVLLEGECLCDWLFGNPKSDAANNPDSILPNYGYSYRQMESSIRSLRDLVCNRFVTDLEDVQMYPDSSGLTDDKLAILSQLVGSGLLTLGRQSYATYLQAGTDARFTIFPIAGTGLSLSGTPMDILVCTEEIEVTLSAPPTADTLRIGTLNEILPEYIDNNPRIIRMSANQANTRILIPIKASTILIDSVLLVSSTDPAFTNNIAYQFNKDSFIIDSYSDTLSICRKESDTFRMKDGYEYSFVMVKRALNTGCPAGRTAFKIKIIPEYAIWVPVSTNQSWNNDANWRTSNANGSALRAGYVPMSHTNVIIPTNSNGIYPILPANGNSLASSTENIQCRTVDEGAQQYITYDYALTNTEVLGSFQTASCHNIHFMPEAKIANQYQLRYDSAWVDMQIESQKWVMCAMPLQGIVSGDFYVPHNGTNSTDTKVFTSNSLTDRLTYPMWQTVFNNSLEQMDAYGNQTWLTSTTWNEPANTVSHLYEPGKGVTLWARGPHTNGLDTLPVTIRFPKPDNSYTYYDTNDSSATWITEDVSGKRTGASRLGYTPTFDTDTLMTVTMTNQSGGNVFLFGNPTMSYVNLEEFFKHNTNLTGAYYTLTPSSDDPEAIVNVASINGFATQGTGNYLLPPMRSVLLQTTTSKTSAQVALSPSDLTIKNTARSGSSPVRRKTMPTTVGQLHITAAYMINGYYEYSNALLALNADAHTDYVQGEDASLVIFDEDVTPSALYMAVDGQALSINVTDRIKTVPLCFRAANTQAGTLMLTFEGVSEMGESLFLYDTDTRTKLLLYDGIQIETERPENDQLRYYIQISSETEDGNLSTENSDLRNMSVSVWLQSKHQAAVSASDKIIRLTAYTMAGTIISIHYPNHPTATVELPQGICMLRIETSSGCTVKRIIVP